MHFGLAPVQSEPDFRAMRAQACLAEALGFSILWTHEHHSGGVMYPDPLMALAVLAPVTERIGLGTNMLLLPIHHPVRVAEAGAMVDVMSGGRLHLGVANGYSRGDLDVFGVESSRRGARLGAGIELIRALWTQETVTASGEDFALEEFRLFPRPLQNPSPSIYIGGHAPRAVERAARLGDEYLISTTQDIDGVIALVNTYNESRRSLGLAERRPFLNRIVCAVANRREKEAALDRYTGAFLSLYDSWGHTVVTGRTGDERRLDVLARDTFIIGEPAECIELIERYVEAGIDHIACLMNFGRPDLDLVERSMRLFGERVIPHFTG